MTYCHNPHTHIVYRRCSPLRDDHHQPYDIVASDPLDVFVKGTAALYSKEYFEAVKAHLNPGGIFSLYTCLSTKADDAYCQERT